MNIEPHPSVATSTRSRRTVLSVAIAVIAAIPISTGSSGTSDEPTAIANGWVAFAASGLADAGDGDDIYLVREGSSPRRITGSDTDVTDEICPAFSPDGSRLAFGQATGNSEDGYSGEMALVITDLTADGVRTATTTIALDGLPDPPCGIWSADGRWVAFGVGPRGDVDEIWVVDTQSDDIRRLSGLSATDLDWAPHAAELAIASDGVVLYSVTADELHPLGDAGVVYDADAVGSIAWSPDGQTIAVMRRPPFDSVASGDLWLMDADGTNERVLAAEIVAMHGLGPVWSPDGERIAYQRRCAIALAYGGTCSEETEVILLTVSPDDPLEPAGPQVVIPPPQTTGPDGQAIWWYPYSVTWSPDSSALLYHAWPEAADLDMTVMEATPDGIVAVSLDGEIPPLVLSEGLEARVYPRFPGLPIQSWARQQAS